MGPTPGPVPAWVTSIERYWVTSREQRSHQVSVKHLHRYLNEFSFRFNNREQREIFAMVVMNLLIGSALRYAALTAPASPSEPSDASASE